jgi:hypothetical protein
LAGLFLTRLPGVQRIQNAPAMPSLTSSLLAPFPKRRDFWEIRQDRYRRRSPKMTPELPVAHCDEPIGGLVPSSVGAGLIKILGRHNSMNFLMGSSCRARSAR